MQYGKHIDIMLQRCMLDFGRQFTLLSAIVIIADLSYFDDLNRAFETPQCCFLTGANVTNTEDSGWCLSPRFILGVTLDMKLVQRGRTYQ